MQVLIVTASLPYPLASGGAIRAYGIIDGLHAAGHVLTLMCFHDGDLSPEDTPLAGRCQQIITYTPPQRTRTDRLRDLITTRQADIALRLYDPGFRDALRALLQETPFDVVQFEGIEAACYLPDVHAARTGACLIFDAFNAEADLQRVIARIDRGVPSRWHAALYSTLQARRIRRYESKLCRIADHVIAVSEEDAALLHPYRPDRDITVVPSGIFVDDYVTPSESVNVPQPSLVFTGKMDYRPNVDAITWFTGTVFPLVQSGTQLVIVGQKPHRRINELAADPTVTVTGWVDTVPPYLHAATLYIAPLRMGSGTRLKLLEAMAAGCAIVATSTAAAGLSKSAKQAMLLADTPQTFAEAINALLNAPEKRDQLRRAAQRVVRMEYDWTAITPRMLPLYEHIEQAANG